MARMGRATWVGPHHDNGLMSRYDIVCVHTIGGGNAPAHAAHFSVASDGLIYQSRDTAYRSAANLEGNRRVIAIENDDVGSEFGAWNTKDGHAVPGFTEEQIEENAQICAWAHRTHGVPLTLCPDSKPTSRGIAYHRQGIDGNWKGYRYGGRVAGGESWTLHTGKVCPGDRRIDQVIARIIPRARQLVGLEPGGFLMALSDQEQRDLYNRIFGMMPQRYYSIGADDEVVEVAASAPGARPATVLDSLDGNHLRERINAVEARMSAPVPVEIDYERIIAGVVERLGALRFDVQPGVAD